jgi:large subunit ribosomal protein L21
MFAIIKTGGKQYRVGAGDTIVVEKLEGKDGPGGKKTVSFGEVLMVGDGADVTLGAPTISGATVTGELVETRKGDKVKVFKKRRRNTYRRKNGHRQLESVIRITEIASGGKSAKA